MSQSRYLEDGGLLERLPAEEGKKNILLIGDSIRMGYCETVKAELSDIANVFYPEENCRCTQYVIISLLNWSGLCDREKVDLVLFNCGHWDVAHWNGEDISLTAIDVYADNIRRIAGQIRNLFPRAKVVFATTTPMNPNGETGVNPRSTAEIRAYNAAAVRALEGTGTEIDDHFAAVENWDESQYADYCHFTEEAFRNLGKIVAQLIRERL